MASPPGAATGLPSDAGRPQPTGLRAARDTCAVRIDLLPFLALSVLLILIPGPDTAVVTKNALLGGRRSGVLASVGVSLGLTVWTVAAALGIAALLRASADAFLALKLAGAVYLIWIGVQMLRAPDLLGAAGLAARRTGGGIRSLRQGLLSDLGNPKIAVFFTSFLPQFVRGTGPAFPALLLLGGIFVVLTLLWLTGYSMLVANASALMRRPAVRKTLDRFTGVVLIGFGVRRVRAPVAGPPPSPHPAAAGRPQRPTRGVRTAPSRPLLRGGGWGAYMRARISVFFASNSSCDRIPSSRSLARSRSAWTLSGLSAFEVRAWRSAFTSSTKARADAGR